MMEIRKRLGEGVMTFLTVLASAGTLICCALPILLVALGFGTVVVGITSSFPWLVTLSGQKVWVFAFSAILLGAAGWALYRRDRTCPSDPERARLCGRLDIWNRRFYWLAVILWLTGFFAAYLLLPLTLWIDSGA